MLILFDMLELDGQDLRHQTLLERRKALARRHPSLGDARRGTLFHAIVDGDHEGIVAKRMDAPYRAGKSPSWVKIKNRAYSKTGSGGMATVSLICA